MRDLMEARWRVHRDAGQARLAGVEPWMSRADE
jgi:hypothetical protein